MYDGTFQEAVGTIFAIAQWFGVMPVVGIKSKSANDLHFHWKSFRTIYAIFLAFGLAVMTVLTVYWTFTHKMEFGKFGKNKK
jgi:gustatory receptor